MLISRSRTVEPLFPDLVVDGTVVEMVSELKILGVTLDSKLAFEKQVRAIAASASRRVGILRKTTSVFRDVAVVAKCFWAFILPVKEYRSSVWTSAATSHLSLLDRVVGQVSRLSGGSVSCDLWHRRKFHLFVSSSQRDETCEEDTIVSSSFDCGIGCMSLSLLVKVWVLLKLQSVAFFYKVDCPLFLPSLRLFLFHFSFFRDLR